MHMRVSKGEQKDKRAKIVFEEKNDIIFPSRGKV